MESWLKEKVASARRPRAIKQDHRVRVAEGRRNRMRARLIEAAMRVHSEFSGRMPVIEDVVKEAKVARGTFYKYFTSLDEILKAVGQDVSDQMTTNILPLYDVLQEPWQRFSVGFRVFLTRAVWDPKWAGFVTRMDAWPHNSLVAKYMSEDLRKGQASGDFVLRDPEWTADFLMGACIGGIEALRHGVAEPDQYIDDAIETALRALGCSARRCKMGVKFSAERLNDWTQNRSASDLPEWAVIGTRAAS